MEAEELSIVVEEAVSKAISQHPCWMSEEDRAMIRDVLQGVKYTKKSFFIAAAGAFLYSIYLVLSAAKGWK